MTVWRDKGRKTYRYYFEIDGQPYRGNTQQIDKQDAQEWEVNEQRRVRRAKSGLPVLGQDSPRFSIWAEVYLQHVRAKGKIRRVDRLEDLLRVVLRFWGARPSDPAEVIPGEPYHDLRLADPIVDPDWIEKFEEWIANRTVRIGTDRDGHAITRPIGKQMRLHYLSILSRLYRVARLPKFRKKTGVPQNPFLELDREKPPSRTVTITPTELRAWIAHTPRHAQVAIAIAALAPKLRLQNVLGLRWDQSFDPAFEFMTVAEHKTMEHTHLPLVIPISTPLRHLLTALRAGRVNRSNPWVITYRGEPITSIRHAVRTGAQEAGLTYGRDCGGVTFHTIRHMAATLLAEVPALTEAQRSATMGQDIQTTQKYTHLRPVTQRPVVEALAARLELDAILQQAFPLPGGTCGGTTPRTAQKRPRKTGDLATVPEQDKIRQVK